MPRRVLGRSYLVEAGVVATLRGFARSTGHAGKKFAQVTLVEGTAHTLPPAAFDKMVEVSALPPAVASRYRLEGVDFVTADTKPASWFRAFPTQAW